MTQDEIIRMAREAGFSERDAMGRPAFLGNSYDLERFAALVAAHEREKCFDAAMKAAEKAVDTTLLLEREACAKVCDAEGREWNSDDQVSEKNYAAYCAAAIRARGESRGNDE